MKAADPRISGKKAARATLTAAGSYISGRGIAEEILEAAGSCGCSKHVNSRADPADVEGRKSDANDWFQISAAGVVPKGVNPSLRNDNVNSRSDPADAEGRKNDVIDCLQISVAGVAPMGVNPSPRNNREALEAMGPVDVAGKEDTGVRAEVVEVLPLRWRRTGRQLWIRSS